MGGIKTKNLFLFILLNSVCFSIQNGHAEVLPLTDALRATYTACVGIDESLNTLKTMAGINTAVTSVGTAAGIGATVTGFIKAKKDEQVQVVLQNLREIEKKNELNLIYPSNYYQWYLETENLSISEDELRQMQTEIEKRNNLVKQSINLGNWRTGLLAGNTATNIAGATIAGTNRADVGLQTMINECVTAVNNLQDSIMQARMNNEDVTEAEQISAACDGYKYIDISPINNRGRNSMISSIVGAATGLAGTVTSAVANTQETRDGDAQREKNLNTASNVLAIGATTSSAVATVFNASQIAAIKKVSEVASLCTEALK